MTKATTKLGFLASTLLLGALAAPSLAQTPPPDPGAPPPSDVGGNGGGRPRWDPAQMRQHMLDRMKDQLGATDEEFTALQPKIEHVFQLQRDMNAGRGMMFRRGGRDGGGRDSGGRDGGPNADQQASPVQKAAEDLLKTLDNKDAKADEIKSKLDAFRAAKSQVKEELTKAQDDLRGALTQRQEAVLVESGLLD